MADTEHALSRLMASGVSEGRANVVGSVATATGILDVLQQAGSLGVTDLARTMGIAKSTAHRLLATLRAAGLVTQTEDARYTLGLRLYELGQAAVARNTLRTVAAPALHELAAATGLTAAMVLPSDHGVTHLLRVEPASGLPLWNGRGASFPSCGAGGIIMAAQRRSSALAPRSALARNNWKRLAIDRARDNGYAIEFGHVIRGIASLAAPVCRLGAATGAIAIIGPVEDFRAQARINRLVQLAARAARTVEERDNSMQ